MNSLASSLDFFHPTPLHLSHHYPGSVFPMEHDSRMEHEHFSQDSPCSEAESHSDKSNKKIRKKRSTYMKIDDDSRRMLLEAVKQGETLKAAAKRYNINYSSAKSILNTFRKEGRIHKKSVKERTAKKLAKQESKTEMSPVSLSQTSQFEEESHPTSDNYQIYNSPDTYKSTYPSIYDSQESRKTGLTINTFGGSLKVNSHSSQKFDNWCVQIPTRTLVFKLGSCGKAMDSNSNKKSTGNWQLNVNVHDVIEPEKSSYKTSVGSVPNSAYTPKESSDIHNFENLLLNETTSSTPLPKTGSAHKQDDVDFGKEFSAFSEMLLCTERPSEGFQNIDFSSYLESSPNNLFPTKISDQSPYMNYEDFGSLEPSRKFYESNHYREGAYGDHVQSFFG